MWIKCIRLFQFRNVEEQTVPLGPQLNILIGENGHGKTNFVEAIYLLLRGNSFRYSDNENLLKFGSLQTAIQAKLENNDFQFDLVCKLNSKEKSLQMNGKKCSSASLSMEFSAVLFSPESLSIIKSESQMRRNFIDEFILNLRHKEFQKTRAEYQRVLKTKNKILKDIRDEKINKQEGLSVLKSLEETFLQKASHYTFLRIQEINKFLPVIKQVAKDIFDQNAEFDIQYFISDEYAMHYTFDQIYNKIQKRCAELHFAEISAGHALVGPQKHDIHFLLNNKDSRIFCSQGQQRALILAFKIAEVVYHKELYDKYPLLILDDVFSELDVFRRGKLMQFLESIQTQTFITTTDEFLNNNFKLKEKTNLIYVKNGTFNLNKNEDESGTFITENLM